MTTGQVFNCLVPFIHIDCRLTAPFPKISLIFFTFNIPSTDSMYYRFSVDIQSDSEKWLFINTVSGFNLLHNVRFVLHSVTYLYFHFWVKWWHYQASFANWQMKVMNNDDKKYEDRKKKRWKFQLIIFRNILLI